MPNFSAVLVGINNYPGAELRGCVNDVIIMRDILVKKYNIPANDIRLVLDERATKKDIIERLEWLISNECPNKLFHYSGHGAQVPVQDYTNNEEPDGMDELLCPVDFNWDGNYILDNQIDDMVSKLAPGHHLTMVIDACHSGTIDRDFDVGNRARMMKAPLDILSRTSSILLSRDILTLGEESKFDLDSAFSTLFEAEHKDLPAKPKFSKHNVSIITGCMEGQTSADAYMSNRYQGALSYVLQGILMQNQSISLNALRAQCEQKLVEYGFSQTPQLICNEENLEKPFIQI